MNADKRRCFAKVRLNATMLVQLLQNIFLKLGFICVNPRLSAAKNNL